MRYAYLLIILSIFILSGCSQNKPAKTVDCVEDSITCSDGSRADRYAENNCIFPACPDGKSYVSGDPEACKLMKFTCAEDKGPFFDDQGCGCGPVTEGKLCTADDRGKECAEENLSVCGWFNQSIKCIRYPCAMTYSNKCMACGDSKVDYWTEGECPNDISPAETPGTSNSTINPETMCTVMGGEYTPEFNECLGITAEQCAVASGEFDECASACRNNPEAEVCTLQCVQVCYI
jgi:hypothetical protein